MLHQIISSLKLKAAGLSLDSRTLQPGEILLISFSAGQNNNIINIIHTALQKKAAAIIIDDKFILNPLDINSHKINIPIIKINHLQAKIGFFAAEFYDYPSRELNIIGVTGTNGKTSCTHFLAKCFELSGLKSAVIGTLGNGPLDNLTPALLTTPDAVNLQKLLKQFKQSDINITAMEVSSHGLAQGRINGTNIHTAIFTNLTQDHLDYHHTLENYAREKYRLFEQPTLKHAIFNLDDPYGIKWAHKLAGGNTGIRVYGVSISAGSEPPVINNIIQIISAKNICLMPEGLSADIFSPWGKDQLKTTLWGKFNLTNLLCVLTVLLIYKIPLRQALEYISTLKNICGRLQLFRQKNKPLVIVDYAHTPDALLKALQTVRAHCTGNIWCIFGCGGDRDKDKRHRMGKIAEHYADYIIITNDNPRTEAPLDIIRDIQEGIVNSHKPILIEPDRRKAIAHAIACAKLDDVIIIAGKGHENYQEINHEKQPYSDILTVKMLLLNNND